MTTLLAGAVLLDMDGTLVDSDAVVERLWVQWAEANGVAPERALEVAHGRQGWEVMSLLLPDRSEELNRADDRWLLSEQSAQLDGVAEVPGAARLVAALSGAPHALVTSADDRLARARMGAAGLAYPSVAVTSERVSTSKPSPEGFLLGASLLGVAAAECVVFEDSEAGILAGRSAGMTVIGVGPRAAAVGPDYAVPDLRSVGIEPSDGGGIRISIAD